MFGVGSTPWCPLGKGVLTRPLEDKTLRRQTDAYAYYRLLASPSYLVCARSFTEAFEFGFLPELLSRYARALRFHSTPCFSS